MKDTFSGCHPFLNLVYFCGTIGVTMFVTHPVILAISLLCGIAYSVILKGWKKTILFNIVFSLPMLVIVALVNPMFNHYGVTILGYLYNGNPFTLESCVYGLVMAMMLVCVLVWFSCYTVVMTSDKFIYLFGKIIPALSLVLSMCLRFVPKFVREASVISDGQKCIGRSTKNGNVLARIRHGITIFSILVTWALENAIETSDSMKCRGYGEKGRTAFLLYRFDRRDLLCLLFLGVTGAATLIGFSGGYAFCSYNPRIVVEGLPLTPGSFLVFFSFFLFCAFPTGMELFSRHMWRQRRSRVEKADVTNFRLWETE